MKFVPKAAVTAALLVLAVPINHGPVSADVGKSISGSASWYGGKFHGRRTANGERYDQNAMTAAHKTLPFGTMVRVTDQRTGKSINVKINDRGPYHGSRIIDLSKAAATKLGFRDAGTTKVCIDRS
jgi:rare lipoprotein A